MQKSHPGAPPDLRPGEAGLPARNFPVPDVDVEEAAARLQAPNMRCLDSQSIAVCNSQVA